MSRGESSNGDACPSNAEHGRMYLMDKTRRQFCAHSDHSRVSDPAIFEYDGLTPASRPAPAIPATEGGASRGPLGRESDPERTPMPEHATR